ncbi:hypothetical protein [Streptomyces sp. CS014]|uniref:hypothetical protein n=1 Tax=Streptomyces sp. CS014 TaxID=2162707 RepID=UPI000D50F3A7|nr:hypothetical protein [Streptomyces sp. CS014]PVD04508.1 hypothetical protein DBP12_03530 [Streptomyces sp. CS014]
MSTPAKKTKVYADHAAIEQVATAAVEKLTGWAYEGTITEAERWHRPMGLLVHGKSKAPIAIRPLWDGTHLTLSIKRSGNLPAYNATVPVAGLKKSEAAQALADAITQRLVPAYQGKAEPIRPAWTIEWNDKAQQEREQQTARRMAKAA